MTATRIDLETTFNEGVAEARVKLAEVRPIDETMFGLRAVLRAGGQEYSVPDVWNRYHQPFIISRDHMTVAELAHNIGISARENTLPHYRRRLEQEGRDRYYIITHAWDQVRLWDFRRRVMELLVNDIKTHKPGLRKNSKEFKRLAQMVFAEAQGLILKQISEALNRQIGSLFQHQDETQPGTIAQEAAKLKSGGRFLREVAADLAILQSGADVIPELLALAEQFDRKAIERVKPVTEAITDMGRVAALVDQIMLELTKANTARRAYARTLQEADSRGLKGVGRQQFEQEAAFALQKAETLQLVIDKMLRSENLLSGEEGMTCDV